MMLLVLAAVTGCASIPGETGREQAENVDALVVRTLADLYAQEPDTRHEIGNCVGYVIMQGKITKVPFVGAGSGYGVAIDKVTGDKTYLEVTRFDIGGGYGLRNLRPVIVFHDEIKFKKFIKGVWTMSAGAEASAKNKDSGAAGGAGSGDLPSEKGYSVHIITDEGLSVTWTVGIFHVEAVKLKE
jgi:hypothetical protein